jgi:glyoxylase-like metal-dependent hydrolase (beta-lactamase superfamily II)
MTEPREIAEVAREVVPGLFYWQIHNSNIGGAISSSHAVQLDGESVFIDPVRLADDALAALPRPRAVLLTARCHQRASWRYRKQFGLEVWASEDAPATDEEPDRRYAEGDVLPGGLLVVRTPGPEWPHYSFLRQDEPGVLFCSDLISHEGGGKLHFIPPEYHEDPAETRRSVEKLLDLPFTILCFDHGEPIVDEPKEALRLLLQETV